MKRGTKGQCQLSHDAPGVPLEALRAAQSKSRRRERIAGLYALLVFSVFFAVAGFSWLLDQSRFSSQAGWTGRIEQARHVQDGRKTAMSARFAQPMLNVGMMRR